MIRHHADYVFDSSVRQWSHPFMIPLHCLWAKSNNRTRGQFECDVKWFCFCFDFVRSHARWGCCFIVCWRGWEGASFKIGHPRPREWSSFGRIWADGGLEHQTTFMDVICVSSLRWRFWQKNFWKTLRFTF